MSQSQNQLPARKSRAELRSIAGTQKALLVCLLFYLCGLVACAVMGKSFPAIAGLGFMFAALLASVSVFILAIKLYGTGLGVVLGILTLIPCIGLVMLVIVNGKATTILKQHGLKVGLLGADLAAIDSLPTEEDAGEMQINE
jgi:hypothetical protein